MAAAIMKFDHTVVVAVENQSLPDGIECIPVQGPEIDWSSLLSGSKSSKKDEEYKSILPATLRHIDQGQNNVHSPTVAPGKTLPGGVCYRIIKHAKTLIFLIVPALRKTELINMFNDLECFMTQ